MIHPNSILKVIWNPTLGIILAYTASLMPYRSLINLNILVSFLTDEDQIYWVVFDQIIDILFWMDLTMNFLSTYYDDQGKLTKSLKKIINNYLRGWFIVDFLSCFPFEQIFLSQLSTNYTTSSSKLKLVKLARLPRLYRLIRMVRVVKLIKYLGDSDIIDCL